MSKRRSRGTSIGVPAPADERESVSIRKIANGYLIEKSGTKRGKYYSHTEYSPGRPMIAAAAPRPAKTAAPKAKARRPSGHREMGYLKEPI
jgi:hypothetical protein